MRVTHLPPLVGIPTGMSKQQAAEALGYQVFDDTLPQRWLESTAFDASLQTGMPYVECYQLLLAGTIWSYDEEELLGGPAFINESALAVYYASQESWQ